MYEFTRYSLMKITNLCQLHLKNKNKKLSYFEKENMTVVGTNIRIAMSH